MDYLAVIERGSKNFSGYFPDVPGCVATGHTLEEVTGRLKEALAFHFKVEVPPPSRVRTREQADQHAREFLGMGLEPETTTVMIPLS